MPKEYTYFEYFVTLATVVGLVVVFIQLILTKRAADEAEAAAKEAGEKFQKHIVLSDFSGLEKTIQQIQDNIEYQKFHLARHLCSELKQMFVELRSFEQFASESKQGTIQVYVGELRMVIDEIDTKLSNSDFSMHRKAINTALSNIEEFLRECVSVEKYKIGGNKNDT